MTVVDGVDYGPLACLIGKWHGDDGVDVAPEEDGEEINPYFEEILYEASGDVSNADRQTLAILRYHQVVSRKSNNKVFHNETGYYTWDAATGTVTQSFAIPRGVAIVAGGEATVENGTMTMTVFASLASGDLGITQSPFMRDNASTRSFSHSLRVSGSDLSYEETTVVDIFDKVFQHTDSNTLRKVE